MVDIPAGLGGDLYFFGTRVSHISPDKLQHITRAQLERVQACVGAEDFIDDDFHPERYQCFLDSGECVGHWILVRDHFHAEDFGFTHWAEQEGELMGQYKMRCAWHPLILLDRYMTPAERTESKQTRDALDVPLAAPVRRPAQEVAEIARNVMRDFPEYN